MLEDMSSGRKHKQKVREETRGNGNEGVHGKKPSAVTRVRVHKTGEIHPRSGYHEQAPLQNRLPLSTLPGSLPAAPMLSRGGRTGLSGAAFSFNFPLNFGVMLEGANTHSAPQGRRGC